MSAPNTFGVTYSTLKAAHFPWFSGEFSVNSNPTAATVTTFISQKAAALHGRLAQKGIDGTAFETATEAEYLWCQETLLLWAAVRTIIVITGHNPEMAKAWQADLDARLKELSDGGILAIGGSEGDVSDEDSQPEGPHTHISEYDLDAGDTADASDVIPVLRRSDSL